MTRAWAVAIKELRQIRRDRRSLLILVFIPALFLFLYGYALNFDIRHVSLAVQDRDSTAESRAVVAAFVHSTYFDVAADISADADVVRLMDADRVRTVLVIPEGYAQKIRSGDTAVLQVIINGDNANSATTILGYVDALLRDLSARLAAGNVRATLEQRGLQVASIEPVAPSLEDVFLDIVDRESTKGAA